MLEAFTGSWVVDDANSDNISPMLKGLGVPLLARQAALKIKAVQEIEASGQSFSITNTSKVGSNYVQHALNGPEQSSKTSKGEIVKTRATWDPDSEFPLTIFATLPGNKGSTMDQRKISQSRDSFVQHLRFTPVGGEPVVMKRVWVRKYRSDGGQADTRTENQPVLKPTISASTTNEPLEWALLSLVLAACTFTCQLAVGMLPLVLSTAVLLGALGIYGKARFLVGTGELRQILASGVGPAASAVSFTDRGAASPPIVTQVAKQALHQEAGSVSVSVTRVRIIEDLYAQFKIKIKYEGAEWNVWRRFSQFDALRQALRQALPEAQLPEMPAKRFFLSNLSNNFLERRRVALSNFLKELLSGRQNAKILSRPETRRFLGIDASRVKSPKRVDSERSVSAPEAEHHAYSDLRPEIVGALEDGLSLLLKAAGVGEGDGWKLHSTQRVGVVDAPGWAVVALLNDESRVSEFDELFKCEELLAEFDPAAISNALGMDVRSSKIKREKFKSPFPLVISARDTVMISATIVEDGGRILLPLKSVEGMYEEGGGGYVRANVMGGGIVIDPVPAEPEKCIVTCVQAIDPNGSIPTWVVNTVAPERCLIVAKISNCLNKKTKWGDKPMSLA